MSEIPPPAEPPSSSPRIAVRVESRPAGTTSRRNYWAYAALICALLACVPTGRPIINVLIGAGAALAGVMAIQKANDPRFGGRRFGTVGLVLGVLVTGFWLLGGAGIWGMSQETDAPAQLAQQFLRDLSMGDIDSARKHAGPLIAPAEFQEWRDTIEPLGMLEDFTAFNRSIVDRGSMTQCELSGTAEFANETRAFEMTLIRIEDRWLVTDLRFP